MRKSNTRVRRALVVEDEPVISRVCSQILIREGIEVDIATNGSIAEGIITQNKD